MKKKLAPKADIFAFDEADVTLEDYQSHKPIKAPVAV